MPVPLYQAKAEFFRMLGHPVRIRVLELLQDGPKPVRDLLAEIDIEPSSVSQQLAILRRSDIVTATGRARILNHEILAGQLLIQTEDNRRMLIAASEVLTVIKQGSGRK